jgi:hypothetical protein
MFVFFFPPKKGGFDTMQVIPDRSNDSRKKYMKHEGWAMGSTNWHISIMGGSTNLHRKSSSQQS